MSTSSRQYIPFDQDPTDSNSLEWIKRQLDRIGDILSDLTDGTGSKLKYIKLVGSVDTFPYTASIDEHVILINADAADVTLNLPAGIDQKRYHIKNTGTYNVTVDPNSTETIDGSTTFLLTPNIAISPIFVSGDGWYVL
jgi:hypothetical protein